MILRFSAILLLASSILITGCATGPMLWKASDISQRSETYIRLTHNNETLATVETSTIRKLVETKERIEKAAGVGYAELVIATGDEPNAFAGNHPKLGRVVGINVGMLKLIGTDWDGYAAIIGHEYAHHALNHGEIRKERETVRQGVATVLGMVLGAAGVPMGGTISDVGTTAVTTVYSRDEEREADRKGFEYMVQAGFDPQGAVRVWEKMNAAGSGALIPFLSTHPMSSERVNNMRALIVAHQTTQVSIGIPQFRKPTGAEEQQGGQNLPTQGNRKWQEEVALASPNLGQGRLPACRGSNFATWTNCFGELTSPTGGNYVGEFKDGNFNGQGTYIYPNGEKYVGEYKDNKRHGHGTYIEAKGGKYVGEYRDGMRNGQGTYIYPNGGRYVGEFNDSRRNGQGIEYRIDGSILRSGTWENDLFVRGQ